MQGSVLFPYSLLIGGGSSSERVRISLPINYQFAAGFAHAKGIRTLSSNVETLNPQLEVVSSFYTKDDINISISKRATTCSRRQLLLSINDITIPQKEITRICVEWWSIV